MSTVNKLPKLSDFSAQRSRSRSPRRRDDQPGDDRFNGDPPGTKKPVSGNPANGPQRKLSKAEKRALFQKHGIDLSDEDSTMDVESFGGGASGAPPVSTVNTITLPNSNLNFQISDLAVTNGLGSASALPDPMNGSERINYATVAGSASSSATGNATGTGANRAGASGGLNGSSNHRGNGNVGMLARRRHGRRGWKPPTKWVAIVDDIDTARFGGNNGYQRLAEYQRVSPTSRVLDENVLDGNGIAVYFQDEKTLNEFMASPAWAGGAFGKARVHLPTRNRGDGPRPTEKIEAGKIKVYMPWFVPHDVIVSQLKSQHSADEVKLLNKFTNLYMVRLSPDRAKECCVSSSLDLFTMKLNCAPMTDFVAYDRTCKNCSTRHRHSELVCMAPPKCAACQGPHRYLQAGLCEAEGKRQWAECEVEQQIASGLVVSEARKKEIVMEAMRPFLKCGECGGQHVTGYGGCEEDKKFRHAAQQRVMEAKARQQHVANVGREEAAKQRQYEQEQEEKCRRGQQAAFAEEARQQSRQQAQPAARRVDPVNAIQKQRDAQASIRSTTQSRLNAEPSAGRNAERNADANRPMTRSQRKNQKRKVARRRAKTGQVANGTDAGPGQMEGVVATEAAGTVATATVERPVSGAAGATPTPASDGIEVVVTAMLQEKLTKMLSMVMTTMLAAIGKAVQGNNKYKDEAEKIEGDEFARRLSVDVQERVLTSIKAFDDPLINVPALVREVETNAQPWVGSQ